MQEQHPEYGTPVEQELTPEDWREVPIADLCLSVRTQNSLVHAGVKTVGQLLAMDEAELTSQRNLGLITLAEIVVALDDLGLHLAGDSSAVTDVADAAQRATQRRLDAEQRRKLEQKRRAARYDEFMGSQAVSPPEPQKPPRVRPAPQPVVSSPLADLIDEYLDHLRPRVGTHTLSSRRSVLTRVFLPWTAGQGVTDLDDVTPAVLDRWSRHLQTEPGQAGAALSEATVRTYCREVNIWLAWAAKNADGDATLRAETLPPRRKTLQVLTREEIDALEAAARFPRDALIVRLLADTGMRVGELLNLRMVDFVREQGRCKVFIRGKTGGRQLEVELALYRRVRAYADGGRPGKLDDAAPLFVALPFSGQRAGTPLKYNGVDQLLRDLRHRAGIEKRVYPHLLRHSFATGFLKRTHDPVTLARILGHKDLRQINETYEHLAADDVGDAMMAYLKGGRKKEAR